MRKLRTHARAAQPGQHGKPQLHRRSVDAAGIRPLGCEQRPEPPNAGCSSRGCQSRTAADEGLSRNNRVTSRTIAAPLMRDQHPSRPITRRPWPLQDNGERSEFIAEPFWMENSAERLNHQWCAQHLRFLQTQDGPRYVAMISNGSSYPNTVMGQILRSVQRFSPCPSSDAAE